jgi:predicted nucleic-acid-binding Zn-ribbon protein
MGKEIMPDATEDKFVIGQKVVKLPPRVKRIPVDDGKGSQLVTLPGKTTIDTFRAQKIYTNPTVMAKNELGKIPEGASLARIQIQLYNAGFYDSNDTPGTGIRTQSDFAAMGRAMEAANARGVTWQDQVAFQVNMQANGASPVAPGAGTTRSSSGGNAEVNKSLNITGPKSARSIFDVMNLKYTSKKSTDTEFSKFYDDLVKAQQKAPIKYEKKKIGGTWYNVQTSDGVNAEEFAETYIFNKINFADENLGGAAGQNLTAVGELAKMYDVNLSLAERGKLAKALTTGADTDNDIRKTLADKAKLKYKMLADDITETVTVKDLLAEQLAAYSRTLELNQADVNISDIESYAFKEGKLLNTSETIQNIKNNNVAYRSTAQANQEAASFALGLARSIGYGV